ncbi:MAG: ABC transporter ATP-binding protein [Candidatus Sungbacteria bacterium]|nr:ABC transporter ATP-binding protein [Candidatus Sungbacteria bacterium]
MSLIEVSNLEKTYINEGVSTPALQGVSFRIEKGEFVAIMGPSGSGKSTLLHILGFLDQPTAGEYLFDGKSADEYSEEDLARIRNKRMGFVFQAFNLLPRTSILENVKLPLLYSDIPESRWRKLAQNAIEAVGLLHRIDHESSRLSGGEKQRVAIARALVLNPDVIFADEPTGNLDSKSGKVIMEILQKLHEENGHTIILITHETYTAEHAGRIITMRDGEIESDRKVEKRHEARDGFRK